MPRKVFVAGEILTAADVNTNLMDQAVMVFDDDTARGSAIPSPSEGMVTYLKDVNQVQAYDGSVFAPVGTILQVVSTVKTDTFSASVAQGAYSTDAMTASITPTSASSKVLVMVQATVSADSFTADLVLFRGGSQVDYRADAASNRKRSITGTVGSEAASLGIFGAPIIYLDSPASTSAQTYSIRIGHSVAGTVSVFLNRSDADTDLTRAARGASSITLMEVAG